MATMKRQIAQFEGEHSPTAHTARAGKGRMQGNVEYWACNGCGADTCFPVKKTCFRCGKSRTAQSESEKKGPAKRTPPKTTAALSASVNTTATPNKIVMTMNGEEADEDKEEHVRLEGEVAYWQVMLTSASGLPPKAASKAGRVADAEVGLDKARAAVRAHKPLAARLNSANDRTTRLSATLEEHGIALVALKAEVSEREHDEENCKMELKAAQQELATIQAAIGQQSAQLAHTGGQSSAQQLKGVIGNVLQQLIAAANNQGNFDPAACVQMLQGALVQPSNTDVIMGSTAAEQGNVMDLTGEEATEIKTQKAGQTAQAHTV